LNREKWFPLIDLRCKHQVTVCMADGLIRGASELFEAMGKNSHTL